MGIISLCLTAVIALSISAITKSSQPNQATSSKAYHHGNLSKSIGLLALVVGILSQLLGLFNAFDAIANVAGVDPSIMAAGFKVSMISTLYGLMVYLISLLVWILIKYRLKTTGTSTN